jgi:hypothetical protein
MANKYQIFVKKYAAARGMSWNCAVCEIKKNGLWKDGQGSMGSTPMSSPMSSRASTPLRSSAAMNKTDSFFADMRAEFGDLDERPVSYARIPEKTITPKPYKAAPWMNLKQKKSQRNQEGYIRASRDFDTMVKVNATFV